MAVSSCGEAVLMKGRKYPKMSERHSMDSEERGSRQPMRRLARISNKRIGRIKLERVKEREEAGNGKHGMEHLTRRPFTSYVVLHRCS